MPSTILRLITRLNVGGPARQALLLSHALRPQFQTILAAGTTTASEGELGDGRVPVTQVPLQRALDLRSDVRAGRAIRRLLTASEPAILHTHMAKAGAVGRLSALSAGRTRPRMVHTFHGHVLDGYFSRPLQEAFVRIERHLAKHTDVLIAVSPQVRDDLLALGIGREDQLRVIPLGLELSAWFDVGERDGSLRRHIGVSDDVAVVGAVGRLVPIKGLETLINAVAQLQDVHLALVGDGESRAELEALTARLCIADRVHFVGWWPDVPGAMADLDVVALTSLNEGTPVALIEALAARRPVVATAVGGVPFVIEDGVTGLLTRPNDASAFSERLDWALRHPEEMARMASDGASRVGQRFASSRLVDDMRALYNELVG